MFLYWVIFLHFCFDAVASSSYFMVFWPLICLFCSILLILFLHYLLPLDITCLLSFKTYFGARDFLIVFHPLDLSFASIPLLFPLHFFHYLLPYLSKIPILMLSLSSLIKALLTSFFLAVLVTKICILPRLFFKAWHFIFHFRPLVYK